MKTLKMLLVGLILAAAAFAQHSVTMAWSWTQGSGDPATGFNLKRAGTSGGPYTIVATVACAVAGCATAATNYSATDTASTTNILTSAQTYFYVVTAVGSGGESAPSNEVSVKIPSAPPETPTGLTEQSAK